MKPADEIKKACQRRARELVKHFRQDGWDVAANPTQIILDLYDIDMLWEIWYAGRKDFKLTWKPDKGIAFTRLDEDAEFAIYNDKTNEIEFYKYDEQWPSDHGHCTWLGRV